MRLHNPDQKGCAQMFQLSSYFTFPPPRSSRRLSPLCQSVWDLDAECRVSPGNSWSCYFYTCVCVTARGLSGLYWSGERRWRALLSANEVSAERAARSGGHDADPLWSPWLCCCCWYVLLLLFCTGVAITMMQFFWRRLSGQKTCSHLFSSAQTKPLL